MAIAAAAEKQLDATPMEGFNPDELDKLLGLNEERLKNAVILPLGYRDAANYLNANLKKVRKPKDEFITELN